MQYIPGQTVSFNTTFIVSVPVNVTNPVVLITNPNNVTVSVSLNQITNPGVYGIDWNVPSPSSVVYGNWTYSFTGTYSGSPVSEAGGTFSVILSGTALPNLGSSTINLNANALSTVPAVKYYLNIPQQDCTNDNWVATAINGISGLFKNYCGRPFCYLNMGVEYLPGTGRQFIETKYSPIDTNAPITIMIDQTVITDYFIQKSPSGDFADGFSNVGTIWREMGWPQGNLSMYRGLESGDMHPFAYRKNITVEYSAGYFLPKDDAPGNPRNLPSEIELVLWKEIGKAFGQRLVEGAKRFHSPAGTVTEWISSELLPETKLVLSNYRKFFI